MLLQRNTEFGYSRKDVILIGAGMIGAGYALYYGLQVGRQRRSRAAVIHMLRQLRVLQRSVPSSFRSG